MLPQTSGAMLLSTLAVLYSCAGGGNGSTPDATTGACTNVTCAGHGSCKEEAGSAVCVCDQGFHPEGLICVKNSTDDPCAGVTCSGHGSCTVAGGWPECTCEQGFHAEGLACLADSTGDPCAGIACSGHGACVLVKGSPTCTCEEGYSAEGLECKKSGAGACCTPKPAAYKLVAEGVLSLVQPETDPIFVGSYLEVVVTIDRLVWSSPSCAGPCCPEPDQAYFRANAGVPFGASGQPIATGARVRVDGSEMKLTLTKGTYEYCNKVEYGYSVIGVTAPGDCCTPAPPKFDVLGQGVVSLSNPESGPVAVGQYREVTAYIDRLVWSSPGCAGGCCPELAEAEFRPNPGQTFGSTGQDIREGGRLRVDGADLRISLNPGKYEYCKDVQYQYVVAGVSSPQPCCPRPPQTFTPLASGVLSLAKSPSDPISVGQYREVVVQIDRLVWSAPGCGGACCPTPWRASFRADASSPFGWTGQDISHGARLRVDGADLQLSLSPGVYENCSDVQYQYVVTGVQ